MNDWNDFDFEFEARQEPDQYQLSAREVLTNFFETNKDRVFFGNQVAIKHEDRFFHWITSRALGDLIEQGLVRSEKRKLAIGSELKLLIERALLANRRDACSVTLSVLDCKFYMSL